MTNDKRTKTHACDLISRQAAIDALKRTEALSRAFGYHAVIDAIEALPSAQPAAKDINVPVKDCISRQAALDIYDDYNIAVENGELESYRKYRKQMLALPSAQPRWIPCSTALPKTEEKVLITCEHLDIYGKPHWYVCKAFHVDRYTMRSDVDWWDEGCDEYHEEDDQYYVLEGWYEYIHNWGDYSAVRITEDKVVAWMELPKPWEGR